MTTDNKQNTTSSARTSISLLSSAMTSSGSGSKQTAVI